MTSLWNGQPVPHAPARVENLRVGNGIPAWPEMPPQRMQTASGPLANQADSSASVGSRL